MNRNLVLLVEDDPDDQELALAALEESGAVQVAVARDGEEALDFLLPRGRAADEELPRVVLLDLHMPKVDGFEVLRRIRSAERTALLPVVLLTSSGEEQDRAEGYRSGANSYVRKPVDFDEYRRVVRQLASYWTGVNETA